MEPLDIATPMGVLITAATFFEGHASARREAALRDLPRAYASVLQPGKKWTTSVLPNPPGWGTTVVAMTLLLLNVLLFIGGWSLDDFTWSVSSALLGAFVVAHTVVFLSGLRSLRDARAAQSLAWGESAYAMLIDAMALEVPPEGQPGRIGRAYEAVGLFEAALARVPGGVDDGTYRMSAADAYVNLAEALLEASRPLPALHSLDRADSDMIRRAGWLDAYGGHEVADWFADREVVRRAGLRARAQALLADEDGEFDAWMAALRTAPTEMQLHTRDLIDAARRADRIGDLHRGLTAIVGENPDGNSWGRGLLDGVAVELIRFGEEPKTIDELRLEFWLHGTEDVPESAFALNLVEALLQSGRDDHLEEARSLLTQVSWSPGLRWADNWARLKVDEHLRRDEAEAAFRLLTDWMGDDPSQWSPAHFGEWVQIAFRCHRLDDLLERVEGSDPDRDAGDQVRRNMFIRRLRGRLDESDAESAPEGDPPHSAARS